ncbi:hypothetical protein PS619_00526 [Pseudomonas fluorescens]|nr:hypothetical protein PS619_00526 [Pseudomonas fluorescens]
MSLRNLQYIDLEDIKNSNELGWLLENHAPENIVIYSEKKKSMIDLGGITYTKRVRSRRRYEVSLSSVCPERRLLTKEIISHMASLLVRKVSKVASIRTRIHEGTYFFDWYDKNYPNSILRKSDFELLFRDYSFHLHHCVVSGALGPIAGCNRQSSAKILLTWASGDMEAHVGRGAFILPRPQSTFEPPLKRNIDRALRLATHLFNQLSNFIIKNINYPFLLKLPNESAWVIPSTRWIYTRHRLEGRNQDVHANWIWDYSNGVIHDAKWIQDFYEYSPSKAKSEHNKVMNRLQAANYDGYHPRRLKLASWAYNSFMVMLFAVTGANLSVFIDLPWDTSITIQPTRQGFRAFKNRAGQVVSYEIKAKFMPYFRKFIELRSFLLQGKAYPYLFFTINKGTPRKITEDFIYIYFKQARDIIDPDLEPINATEFRKYKTEWSANNLTIEDGARLAQNTEQVFSEKYSRGNRLIQAIEIDDYFTALAKRTSSTTLSSSKIPAGECADLNNPVKIINEIRPSCSTHICCIFCEHFLIHRNKEDIWKLLSIKHICSDLTKSAQLGKEETIKLVIVAIDSLITELSKDNSTKNIVDECYSLIDEGYLSDYWQRYLDLLINLGLIQ